MALLKFHYLMDLHYSQTIGVGLNGHLLFHYLMDLHYSQTYGNPAADGGWFHYLMDLHYSQTSRNQQVAREQFHYLMDLHYSQTTIIARNSILGFTTLWIYTILKHGCVNKQLKTVSLPYGFTLFSN